MSVLNTKVLVLNRSYLPIHVTSVKRAFVLLYQDVARAVDEQYRTFDFDSWSELSVSIEHDSIGLVSRVVRVPRVILLLAFDRVPKRHVRFSRYNIYARDGNTCQYCANRLARDPQPRPPGAAATGRSAPRGAVRRPAPPPHPPQGRTHARAGGDAAPQAADAPAVDALHGGHVQSAPLPRVGAVPQHGRRVVL